MLVTALLSLLVGGLPDQSAVSEVLVGELGSPKYQARVAAERSLSRLGRLAMPALRAALASQDLEIRLRATSLLTKIEERMLVEATNVDMKYGDKPLAEVIDSINRQAGLQIVLLPETNPIWRSRKINLQSEKPLPFWRAMDELCRVADLHNAAGQQSFPMNGSQSFALYEGYVAPPPHLYDHGPFRIQLNSLHYQSEVHLSPEVGPRRGRILNGPGLPTQVDATPSRQFFLQMTVAAEPRLTIGQNGPINVSEALNEAGESLLLAKKREVIQHASGYFGINPSPAIRMRVDLAYPDQPGQRIKRIKGTIPLIVSTRKPDPLTISMVDHPGKTLRHDDVTLTIGEVRKNHDNHPVSIEVTLKVTGTASANLEAGGFPGAVTPPRAMASPQQLELLDNDDQPVVWFPSNSSFNGEETKLTMTLLDRGAPITIKSLRYHSVLRGEAEVPFEFRDLPIP